MPNVFNESLLFIQAELRGFFFFKLDQNVKGRRVPSIVILDNISEALI